MLARKFSEGKLRVTFSGRSARYMREMERMGIPAAGQSIAPQSVMAQGLVD